MNKFWRVVRLLGNTLLLLIVLAMLVAIYYSPEHAALGAVVMAITGFFASVIMLFLVAFKLAIALPWLALMQPAAVLVISVLLLVAMLYWLIDRVLRNSACV